MEPGRYYARVNVLALVAVAIWFFGATFVGLPAPRGSDAAPTEFSAARAYATLGRLLGPEVPHPVSTPAAHAVRDRIRAEFARLGMRTTIYRAPGCNSRPKYGYFACGTVEDVVAEVAPGADRAIVLVAHYDSVPAGPGASDDQSGVATILETARALKARGLHTRHPIVALLTEGEEAGLLGAEAFLDNPAFRARTGVAINVEGRGSRGPSLLIQTGSGNGALIDLYAANVPNYAASSLMPLVYRLLPNDTDFSVFLDRGFTGYNFAFIGNVAVYHSPLDLRASLEQATLQSHGDNLLGLTAALIQADFATLNSHDEIYLSLFGKLLPRLPVAWAVPLAALTLLLLFAAAWLSGGEVLGIGRRLAAAAIPVVALAGAAAVGWLLHEIASLVAGQPDPSFAHPVWLRLSLAFGVAAVLLVASRLASARMTALSVWIWIALLGLATALYVPGFSPYFLFPALIAAPLLLAQSRARGAWTGALGEAALFVAALPALAVWLALAAQTEQIQGLFLHPAFTVPAAMGAMTLLPLLAARPPSRRASVITLSVATAGAIVLAVVAGLMPAYSATAPQRLNIDFVDDHDAKQAKWVAETGAPLPASLRATMPFSSDAAAISPLLRQPGYSAPAGDLRFALPAATVVSRPTGQGRIVTLTLHSSTNANRVVVVVPKDAGLVRVTLDGKVFVPSLGNLNPAGTIIVCATDDCRAMTVTLDFASRKPVAVTVGEQRYGLPADGVKLVAARPATAMASQSGDTTVVYGKLVL